MLGGWRGCVRNGPSTSSNGFLARFALPDTDSGTLDSVLSAEGAGVAGVLRDLHLLDLLTERGTVSVGELSASVSCSAVRFVVIKLSQS